MLIFIHLTINLMALGYVQLYSFYHWNYRFLKKNSYYKYKQRSFSNLGKYWYTTDAVLAGKKKNLVIGVA